MRLTHSIAWILAAAPALSQGQDSASIEEVILTAPREQTRASRPALVLDHEALRVRQSVAVADVFRTVTGVFLRTNSRGQAVPRIRGAEERQTLVFLDGAPLAVPWDGRADLSLLPAGLIERIEVTRGLAPIEYGPNAVAGAIDLVTFIPQEKTSLRAEIQGGSLGLRNINAVAGFDPDNGWSFVAAGSTIHRDAERIADKDSVAFDPSTTRARTNTDMSGDSLFAAAAHAGDSHFVRASLLHGKAERGVAAQGDLNPGTGVLNPGTGGLNFGTGGRNPAAALPRFWRMPERNLTQATLNGNWNLREGVETAIDRLAAVVRSDHRRLSGLLVHGAAGARAGTGPHDRGTARLVDACRPDHAAPSSRLYRTVRTGRQTPPRRRDRRPTLWRRRSIATGSAC